MAKVKFVKDATTLQFEVSISYPSTRSIEKVQILDRTAAGTLRVEDRGITIETFKLIFKNITDTDYNGLVSFFNNTVNGAFETFTYYDENGSTHTVRFITKKLDFPRNNLHRYSGELILEIS